MDADRALGKRAAPNGLRGGATRRMLRNEASRGWDVPDFVLRVEGLNFDATVFDTEDVSTVRGASLALEVAVRGLGAVLAAPHSEIYAGASQAAFLLTDTDAEGAAQAAASVRAALDAPAGHDLGRAEFDEVPPAQHMVFAVETVEVRDGRLDQALESAQALAQRRQLRMPTFRPPEPYVLGTGEARADAVCAVDPKRPVSNGDEATTLVRSDQFPQAMVVEDDVGGDGLTKRIRLSRRAVDLREYGRTARRELYRKILKRELPALDEVSFAQSFEDIVTAPPTGLAPSVPGKLAVLYFDGAGFGAIRARHLEDRSLDLFSAEVRRLFDAIVADLLETFVAAGDAETSRRHAVRLWDPKIRSRRPHLRLETLMLGGEDFCVIVPAWLAVATVRRVLETAERFDARTKAPLHLRCGALICDHKTPIRSARRVAHDLCDDARAAIEGAPDDVAQFHVIESVETPDAALGRQREALFGVSDPKAFCFRLDALRRAERDVARLKREFPRSQVYKLIRRLKDPAADPDALVEATLRRSDRSRIASADALTALLPDPDARGARFGLTQLAELWDYVDPFDEFVTEDA